MTASIAADVPWVTGPFEIHTLGRGISSGAFPDLSANPFSRRQISEFEVRYRGKAVSVPLQDGKYSSFYEAWSLPSTAGPAVLLALQGFYLVSIRNGQLTVTVLSKGSDDLASLQWLDSDAGQPAPQVSIGIGDKRGQPRSLQGGRLLLLNHDTVLDAASLQVYPAHSPLMSPDVYDYAVAGEPAKALSPDRRHYVLAGSIDGGGEKPALIVVDYQHDTAYAVPFDKTATHYTSVWDVKPAWVDQHFSWITQADGAQRLRYNSAASAPAAPKTP